MNLDKRLTELEARRPAGELTAQDMTDEQLVRYITNGESDTITDEQLVRIAAGATWEQVKHG